MSDSEVWRYLPNGLVPEGRLLPEGVHRVAAAVEYDGSAFCGWQRQSHSPSVQQVVELALSEVAAEPTSLICAGRTDSGVHATNQIIHFDTRAERLPRNWLLGANANLPDSVRIHWADEVSAQFHARFSATARTYRYIIANHSYRPALFHQGVAWQRKPLNEKLMDEAAQQLLGEQDFSSFRAAGCQSNSPNRNVYSAKVWRQGELVIFEIKANAFLYHMVRNLVGALTLVGQSKRDANWLAELLTACDRTLAPATAAPNGLYLVGVEYPENGVISSLPRGPLMIVSD